MQAYACLGILGYSGITGCDPLGVMTPVKNGVRVMTPRPESESSESDYNADGCR